MPESGWISVRNIPSLKFKTSTERSNFYFALLKDFFEAHHICPTCKGHGYTSKKTPTVITAPVRFRGIKELETLVEEKKAPISDIIREIISLKIENRRLCQACAGTRFIPK